MRLSAVSNLTLLFAFAAATSHAQDLASWAGTWTLDTAQSSCAGTDTPVSETAVISAESGGTHYVIDAKYKDESVHMDGTFTSDGKSSPVSGYAEYVDSGALTEAKPGHRRLVMMKNGKRVEWDHFTLSKSGKRMHGNLAGIYEGKKWTCKWVFVRQ